MHSLRGIRRTVTVTVLIAAVVALLGPTAHAGGKNVNPGVLPVHSNAFGNSYGEWSARWWQWLLAIPAATNPNLDPTGADCAQGQGGKVWFLAGTFGDTVVRSCTVPNGKAIFFPILNAAFGAAVGDCEPTGVGPCVVSTLRAGAAAAVDNPDALEVTIDGVPLGNLDDYRVQSPVFSVTGPAGGLIPPGTFSPMVSDGYWILLTPLSTGEHTIHFRGVPDGAAFVVDVTYHLTVGR